ncbi:MAG: hypothetical protein QXK49_01435 [Candidatus Aenigmatarchaeota archaeon]
MYKLKVLLIAFFVFLFFTPTFRNYPYFAALTCFLSALIAAIGLFHFLSEFKSKKIGKIKIEEVTFVRNFVFRAYTKVKDVWIVFDKKAKMFRPADFRELPIKAGLTTLFGLLFLYVSYLILSTINQALEFLAFRSLVLIIFLVLGCYNFFVGIARISSLETENSIKVCKLLNKNRSLKNFLIKEKAFFEITPNFLLWNGFVTSVEFVIPHKIQTKVIEKDLIQISKIIEKIK